MTCTLPSPDQHEQRRRLVRGDAPGGNSAVQDGTEGGARVRLPDQLREQHRPAPLDATRGRVGAVVGESAPQVLG